MIFLPVVLILYWGMPHRFRKYFLLAASYYFYMCWKPEFIVLILFSTAVNYFCSLGLERFVRRKKLLLTADLVVNLGLLFVFKYLNFFGETVTALCRAVSIPFAAPVLDIILPVGISFYTFQTLIYTIDVYRGKMKAERDFVTFALFVSYFPQLVAGPIERADNLLPQLKKERVFRYEQAAHGARLMAWGFFKKCVCAAYLAQLADAVYNDVPAASGGAAALATAAFALQIYCDFGGYSDIARGLPAALRARDDGRGADGEFQGAVLRPVHPELLAAVAHIADELVSGVCVLSSGREPEGACPHPAQHLDRVCPQRAVARGKLDVCSVGRASRAVSQRGAYLAARPQRCGQQAPRCLL